MKRYILIPLVAISFIAVMACNNTPATKDRPANNVASVNQFAGTLGSLNLVDEHGDKLDVSILKGKNVFVNIWASWCLPCKLEMPGIQSLYERTSRDSSVFLMISVDDNTAGALEYIRKKGYTMPVYFASGALPDLLNVEEIPASFLFDRGGALVKTVKGIGYYNTKGYVDLLSR
jgi:thiol-disulfide isomerase/thioredoxin